MQFRYSIAAGDWRKAKGQLPFSLEKFYIIRAILDIVQTILLIN